MPSIISQSSYHLHLVEDAMESESGGSLGNLFERYRDGDQQAANEIYLHFAERLRIFANSKIGPHLKRYIQDDTVAHATLEVLLKMIREHVELDTSAALWPLLRTIALRQLLQLIAKRVPRITIQALQDWDIPSAQTLPEEAVMFADELQDISKHLKPIDLKILDLKLEGLSSPEIAARLGCSRHSVARHWRYLVEFLNRRRGTDGP
jgi:DNA-directed RNA polymerase specialized sigma24 family protein